MKNHVHAAFGLSFCAQTNLIIPKQFFPFLQESFCYKLCNTCYKLSNTCYKLCNTRYKVCNKKCLAESTGIP